MGWIFTHKPKGTATVDFLKQEYGAQWTAHVVDAAATLTSVTWLLRFTAADTDSWESLNKDYIANENGEIFVVGFDLVRHVPKDSHNFGWKCIGEEMGPCEPGSMRIIRKASPLKPESESYARAFRERSAKAEQLRNLKPGTVITLKEPATFGDGVTRQLFTVVAVNSRGRKRRLFQSKTDGVYCRVSPYALESADIVEGAQ